VRRPRGDDDDEQGSGGDDHQQRHGPRRPRPQAPLCFRSLVLPLFTYISSIARLSYRGWAKTVSRFSWFERSLILSTPRFLKNYSAWLMINCMHAVVSQIYSACSISFICGQIFYMHVYVCVYNFFS
jgi:hypothetical protein